MPTLISMFVAPFYHPHKPVPAFTEIQLREAYFISPHANLMIEMSHGLKQSLPPNWKHLAHTAHT